MQSDWLDNVDWLTLGLGIALGVVGQTLMSVILVVVGVPVQSITTLIVTELMVLAGGFVAAWRVPDRNTKVLNGVAAALVCAFVSLVASVSVDPENGRNLPGLLFLFGSYTLMGMLGALLSEFLERNGQSARPGSLF